jgi:hypothetical protein
MSRASTEMEAKRKALVSAVEKLSPEDIKVMVLASLALADPYEMDAMAAATSYKSFENLDFEMSL